MGASLAASSVDLGTTHSRQMQMLFKTVEYHNTTVYWQSPSRFNFSRIPVVSGSHFRPPWSDLYLFFPKTSEGGYCKTQAGTLPKLDESPPQTLQIHRRIENHANIQRFKFVQLGFLPLSRTRLRRRGLMCEILFGLCAVPSVDCKFAALKQRIGTPNGEKTHTYNLNQNRSTKSSRPRFLSTICFPSWIFNVSVCLPFCLTFCRSADS